MSRRVKPCHIIVTANCFPPKKYFKCLSKDRWEFRDIPPLDEEDLKKVEETKKEFNDNKPVFDLPEMFGTFTFDDLE